MATQKQLREYAHALQKVFIDNNFMQAEQIWDKIRKWLALESIRVNPELKEFKDRLFKCTKAGNPFTDIDISKQEELIEKYGFPQTHRVYRSCGCCYDEVYGFRKEIINLLKLRVPTIEFLIAELSALQKEFNNLEVDEHYLTVVTKDIYLENTYFGPFKIGLNFGTRRAWAPFIEAQDPQYPGGDHDSCFTHPHVEDNHLCLGDGEAPIRKAAEQGRFFDYFQLVNTVLSTYGKRLGPYVELEAWDGVQCGDCGCYTHEDNTFYCEECNQYSCDECWIKCESCREVGCIFCVKECYTCDYRYCSSCVTECSCGAMVCSNCIVKCVECDSELCESCEIVCESCEQTICNTCNKPCEKCGADYHSECGTICCEDEEDE